jgi:hypothetical protein
MNTTLFPLISISNANLQSYCWYEFLLLLVALAVVERVVVDAVCPVVVVPDPDVWVEVVSQPPRPRPPRLDVDREEVLVGSRRDGQGVVFCRKNKIVLISAFYSLL